MRVASPGASIPPASLEDDGAGAARIGPDGLEAWRPKLRAALAGLVQLVRRHDVGLALTPSGHARAAVRTLVVAAALLALLADPLPAYVTR